MPAKIFASNTSDGRVTSFAWQWGVPLFALCGMVLLLALSANVPLFLFINRSVAVLGDTLWSHFTVLGDTTIALMIMLPLIVRRPELAWRFVLAALLATLWSQGMKEMFSTLRPPAILAAGSYHLIGQDLQNNSFPSGHTTTIFVLAGFMILQILNGTARIAMLILAVLVGTSRIACGVHWPLDVLGGMFGGWLSALGGIWLAQRWHRVDENIWLPRILALLGMVLAIWSLVYYDNNYAGTWWLQAVISIVCLFGSLSGQLRLWKVGAL
jgi:membrane-associated phospholipid phosphatase